MKIYLSKSFAKWVKKESISTEALLLCVDELEKGLFEACLANGLYKKRMARAGSGKKSGYRTIVAFKRGQCVFFLYAFAKNKRANISELEKAAYKKLGDVLLGASEMHLKKLIKLGEIKEVENYG